ncbi:MAG: hypothetical protein CMM01_18825 [Rhodopirellula sp.]|nr:hypothetical protein [Rhodopirellula sp.]OUX49912.1 MAG: hypothetical protein CBE43_08755 [Rhodopirellula sp. TMED283]
MVQVGSEAWKGITIQRGKKFDQKSILIPSILSGPPPTHHAKRRKYPDLHETLEVQRMADLACLAGGRHRIDGLLHPLQVLDH